jgi:hypothetical protein
MLRHAVEKTCTIGCLLVCAALGQTEGSLRTKAVTIRYPPLAEVARIEGDVRLEANSGAVTLVSGHPLLAPLAIANAKTLGSLQGQTKLDMTYHFVLVDTNAYNVPTSTTVKRGNALERAILRVLGFKAEKVVHSYRCEQGVAPASDIKTDGAVIEIWVYGRSFCLQTNTALVARR